MCDQCWAAAGAPAIQNDKVLAAQNAIDEVYYFNGLGGSLNVVLDDYNTEDRSIAFCDQWIDSHQEPDGQYEAERKCCDLLKQMTVDERMSAISLFHGDWKLVAS